MTFLQTWDDTRYTNAYLRSCMSESMVQLVILQYLHLRHVWAFPVDVGAKQLQGRAFGMARRAGLNPSALRGRTGAGKKGVCDIIGIVDRRPLFLEVKAPMHLKRSPKTGNWVQLKAPGLPTQEQLEFLGEAARAGAIVGVVWGIRDVEQILDAYLGTEADP